VTSEQCINVRIEYAVDTDTVFWKEGLPTLWILLVEVHGDVEGIANVGIGRRVVDHREGVEVFFVWQFAHGGDGVG